MENNKFLKVIEELGKVLMDKDNEILFQKYEIEKLKKKITEIENYLELFGGDNGKRDMEAS